MSEAVILFDGVCNLCNGAVQFIIARDRAACFRFASLQSDAGRALLTRFNLPADQRESLVLVSDDRAFLRSGAALRIARRLRAPWPLLYVFVIVPPLLRDGLYNLVARRRYRWFGKRAQCMVPTPAQQARFLT